MPLPTPSDPEARWVLAATILASSLAFIDGSVVNVALDAIGRDLGGGAAGLQWIVNAYLLPLSALVLFGGAAGDRFGTRRLFLAGIVGFALASAACGLAPSLEVLLAARAVQGVAAAALTPNSLAILGQAFAGEARGRAVGTWAAAGAIAGALGPLAGGWLVEVAGWRSIFLVNLPLAAGALWIARRHVVEAARAGRGPLDWPGVGLATAGLGLVTYGLTRVSNAMPGGWPALMAGGLALVLFVGVEHRRADRALMPLALFGTSGFVGLSLLTVLLYAALGGLFVALPFVLIEARGYTPLQAGAALLPLPLVLGLASRAAAGLAARIGPRVPLTAGPLVVAVGFLLMGRIASEGAPAGQESGQGAALAAYGAEVLPGLLVVALGTAAAVAPLTVAVMASVDGRFVGTANGINSALARTGGLLATAMLGFVLSAHGAALARGWHAATVGAAAAAALAGFAALLLLKPEGARRG